MGLRHYVCLAAFLFNVFGGEGLSKEINDRLTNYIEMYGAYTPVSQASTNYVDEDGRCKAQFESGLTPLTTVECCGFPSSRILDLQYPENKPNFDGYCRGSDCTIFGYHTKYGSTCEHQTCECIDCVWDRQNNSCFDDPNWHLNADGEPDMVNGRHCFGTVRCKMNDQGIRPQQCNDTRVGALCMENSTIQTDPWLYGGLEGNRTPWIENFFTCGNFLCDVDEDCSYGQVCNLTGGLNSCDKCNYTGICVDPKPSPSPPPGNFTPDCFSCPPCVPCDDAWRSVPCQELVTEKPGWNYVDIPGCQYDNEDLVKIINTYNCDKPVEGCDTWVCQDFIPESEFLQLTKCLPPQPII